MINTEQFSSGKTRNEQPRLGFNNTLVNVLHKCYCLTYENLVFPSKELIEDDLTITNVKCDKNEQRVTGTIQIKMFTDLFVVENVLPPACFPK